MIGKHGLIALAAVATAGFANAAPARAQTAYDINRLNAAIQVCNSGLGSTPECAKLRGQLGAGGVPGGGLGGGGLGGLGGGKGAAAAGIFSLLSQVQARNQVAAPPPAAAPAVSPAAIQQAIATCVQNARGDSATIQACLRIAEAAPAPQTAAAPAVNPFGSLLPRR